MINIDYSHCGDAPLWLRQDDEPLLNLHISSSEIKTESESCAGLLSRIENKEIILPIRVGDYRNIEYCCCKSAQLNAHVPSLGTPDLAFMLQGTRVDISLKSPESIVVSSCVGIKCNKKHVFIQMYIAGTRVMVDMTPEWREHVSIGYSEFKFGLLYEYLNDISHLTDKHGSCIGVRMPTMRSMVFRQGTDEIIILPDNIVEVNSSCSATYGKFVRVSYKEDDSLKYLELYFNPRNLNYGEPNA